MAAARRISALLIAVACCATPAERLIPLDPAGYGRLISSQRGSVVLVDFWATWCEPCREELPLLVALEKQLHDTRFHVITVSVDEPEKESEALQILTKTGFRARAYVKHAESDEAFIDSVDKKWSGAVPALFLYDQHGELKRSFVGETRIEDVEAAARALISSASK